MIIDIYKLSNDYFNMGWKDMNRELEDEQISRINSAGLTNITLENLWRDCYNAMAKGNLILWNRKLDAIWTNLGGDCKQDGDEYKEMMKIDLKIANLGSLKNKARGFNKKESFNSLNLAKQYLLLKDKALFLKRLQNSQGKGTAYKSDDEDDID